MNYNEIIAMAVSFVIGIGAVAAFLGKFLPKMEKYLHIAKDALTLLDDAVLALKDGKATPEEIAQLEKDVAEVKAAFSA